MRKVIVVVFGLVLLGWNEVYNFLKRTYILREKKSCLQLKTKWKSIFDDDDYIFIHSFQLYVS